MLPRAMLVIAGVSLLSTGCVAGPVTNPSFAVSVEEAKRGLKAMLAAPKPLARPVVVLAGWQDPGIVSVWLAGEIRKISRAERVIDVSFLKYLDTALEEADYELLTYARLGDVIVGAANSAPPGRTPWWVSNRPLDPAHVGAYHDPRIVVDVARRLRGEAPFTSSPPLPLPED